MINKNNEGREDGAAAPPSAASPAAPSALAPSGHSPWATSAWSQTAVRAAVARVWRPAAGTSPGPAPRPPPALTMCGGGGDGALPAALTAPESLRAPLPRRGRVPCLLELQTKESVSGPSGPGTGWCGGRRGWRPATHHCPLHPASNRPRHAAALPGHRARPHARRTAPAHKP